MVKDCFGGKDDAVQAEAALGGTFIHESLLDRMRFFRGTQAFERGNFVTPNSFHGHHAGTNYMTAKNDRAGSALCHSTSELWSAQTNFVCQGEQQRCLGIKVESIKVAVYFE